MRKLYISDLDGTLLGKPGELSKTGVELLNKIIEEGALFSVATGRSLISAADILEGTNINLPIVSNNGARISTLNNLKHVYSNFIDAEITQGVLDILINFKCSPFINGETNGTDILLYEEKINEGTKLFIDFRKEKNDPRLKVVNKYNHLIGVEVINFNIIDDTEKLEKVKEVLNKTYGNVLDMHMFEFADRAIAVENACLELKELADIVIGPNSEDSVLKFILKELKNS